MFVVGVFLATRPQPASAKFVLAAWDFPEERGEGIFRVSVWENSTGSFQIILHQVTGEDFCYYNDTAVYELNHTANTALRFQARVHLNYTALGLTHPDDIDLGRNFFRIGVEMFVAGSSIFSLENMTYFYLDGLFETGVWWYLYLGDVDIILDAGQIYTVVFDYEIFGMPEAPS